jgi:hypothetical protein
MTNRLTLALTLMLTSNRQATLAEIPTGTLTTPAAAQMPAITTTTHASECDYNTWRRVRLQHMPAPTPTSTVHQQTSTPMDRPTPAATAINCADDSSSTNATTTLHLHPTTNTPSSTPTFSFLRTEIIATGAAFAAMPVAPAALMNHAPLHDRAHICARF